MENHTKKDESQKNELCSPLVLVVEDNSLYMRLICDVLHSRGYKTFEVTHAGLVMEAIKYQAPDLILLDIQKDNFIELSLIQQIRKVSELETIPIIAVLMQHLPSLSLINLEAAYEEYIFRPIPILKLMKRIDLWFAKEKKYAKF